MSDDELLDRAQDWLAEDPDPATRAELETLIETAVGAEGVSRDAAVAAVAELRDRFSGRLAFGTAGLRAELGAGPMRMNRVVVAQAAAGLAAYLLARSPQPSAVIGYDGRHNSEVFARDAATVLAGAGVTVRLLPEAVPTPVLAFAVRHFGTSAGIMITASHNPPRDNGVKVYLGGEDAGSQIVPPADAEIAAAIARAAATPVGALPRSTDFTVEDREVVDAYVEATAAVVAPLEAAGDRDLRVVYTAMHGVGLETAAAVFARAGLPAFIPVAAQAEPDPDFPTVAFPNPEEPGALDLAFEAARAADADLVVANDPDADRLAIAVPDPSRPEGWRRLTGNEVGLLLGWSAAYDWSNSPAAEAARRGEGPIGVLANSLVSSPALARVAARFGLEHVETLTGFKWISRVPGLVYGYEEALGYLVDPGKVRDKDGISAAARFVSLARRWRQSGLTAIDCLGRLEGHLGGFASGQVSIRVDDLAEIARLTAALREQPPAELAGRAVATATDYLDPAAPFPGNDILRYDLADGARVIVRPSGTEPKLKVYLDADTQATIDELDAAVRALLGV